MRSICITFRSVTLAQRGERLLRAAGMDCMLLRTPRRLEERGCGYCLRIASQHAPKAVEQLQRGGVPFNRVLAIQDGGVVEVVTL